MSAPLSKVLSARDTIAGCAGRIESLESIVGAEHARFFHIPAEMTFRQWCETLADSGLRVDGHPFRLDNRKALHWIYDLIPSTAAEAYGLMVVLQKGAQMGLTIWEVLADLYMAIKFGPCTIGMYVPDAKLAPYKSEHRFMRLVRSIPSVYQRMTVRADTDKKTGEGNKLTRTLGESIFLFLWTSGKMMTESFPMDVISFDEVQGMTPDQIDTVRERMSASSIRYMLLLSTAKWPEADINYWYLMGTQHEFYTRCPSCGDSHVLSQSFPRCVRFDADSGDYRYCCPGCDALIDDTQDGEYVATFPDRKVISVHLSQILSPTVTAREMIETWGRAETSDQRQNFYNRKLGLPYADPDQIPVNMAILQECAEDGMKAGVAWKSSGADTYMGIDQMGNFNVVEIKERLSDGRQAVIHVEAIYSSDPFARCSELMKAYGVAVCVVETLPNYNDAKRFAARHRGRVFLASYGDMSDDWIKWGDAVVSKADRKTDIDERDRYTVVLNQYKAMQMSLQRFVKRLCVFADPAKLWQDVVDKGVTRRVAILKEVVWLHLCKVALVVEEDAETRKKRPKVVKVGIDPHFAYANMLCDVAYSRAHGTTQFILPTSREESVDAKRAENLQASMPGLPKEVVSAIATAPEGSCGRCVSYREGTCDARGFRVGARDPGCPLFVRLEDE